ncbi:MAG: TolC family protein [Opitutae bacterium]|nr:TolC family protein [Opitutae bacterium]
MKRIIVGIVGLGWMAWAGGASGAEEAPARPVFTLRECIDLGLKQAAAARNADRDEQIAGTRIGQVRAQVLPELKAKGGYTRLDEAAAFEFDGARVEMGLEDNYSAGVEVSQLLYSGGSVRSALKAATLYREVAQARVRQAKNDLVRDIRTAFNDILLEDEQVKVQAASLAQLEDLLAQAESRHRQQTASEFDVLTARVRVANARPLLIHARKQAELARARFRSLVQLEAEDFELAGELAFEKSERSLEEWQALGLEQRPELVEQRKFLGMWAADIRAERGGYLPQIRAFAGYDGTNPESGSARESWEWGWRAGVTAEWDLFDGALRRNRIREKSLELAKAGETLADSERQVALEIQSHYLDQQQAAETVSASRDTVELAEKSLEIARTRYENGLATNLDFTDANLSLSIARLTRLQALHDHLNALARLEQASGEEYETGETP